MRFPLPDAMRFARSQRGGISARKLLVRDWRIRTAALAAMAAACCGEVLDPAPVFGWRYEHRAEHALVGAAIDVVTIEAERVIAPRWTHRHPVLAMVVAGLVVGTAAVCKESIDVHRGREAFHHQLGDIAFTEAGGVAAGVGFTYAFRF